MFSLVRNSQTRSLKSSNNNFIMELTSLYGSATATCHSFDEWLVLYLTVAVSEELESCVRRASHSAQGAPDPPSSLALPMRHESPCEANLWAACTFISSLPIQQRSVFIKCVSCTQERRVDWNVLLRERWRRLRCCWSWVRSGMCRLHLSLLCRQ